jgi:hypothetical protein
MKESEVRERAFGMPLTSPAYPIGSYRFCNREYLIITYRTDPQKLRELVPEPTQGRGICSQFRIHPSAGFDRLRRLFGEWAGYPSLLPGATRAATPTACFSTTIRPSQIHHGGGCGRNRSLLGRLRIEGANGSVHRRQPRMVHAVGSVVKRVGVVGRRLHDGLNIKFHS